MVERVDLNALKRLEDKPLHLEGIFERLQN
jgi:hypothetical protein